MDEHPLLNNIKFNIFGFLAYQKIYADYYRDSQWEKVSPSTFNVDFMDGVTNDNSIESYLEGSDSDPIIDNYNMFDLRYCNWQKDLFHGLVPHQQYGVFCCLSKPLMLWLVLPLSFLFLHFVKLNFCKSGKKLHNPVIKIIRTR